MIRHNSKFQSTIKIKLPDVPYNNDNRSNSSSKDKSPTAGTEKSISPSITKQDESESNNSTTDYHKKVFIPPEEKDPDDDNDDDDDSLQIPEVYKKQGTMSYSSCTGYSDSTCPCSSPFDNSSTTQANNQRVSYLDRRNYIPTERLYTLRKQAQDAIKFHKTFTIRGCFYSIRKSLIQRGWVEKLDIHRRAPTNGLCHMVIEDLTQHLPARRPGESRRQHLMKCERNIMSRFLEHMPIDFLWSARKEKTDWIDMARNPAITINKFHKSPFNTKEGLCSMLREFHWYFEEGKSETYCPRTYNVWSADGLSEFVENFRMTACIAILRLIMEANKESGLDGIVSQVGKIPVTIIDFALRQCKTYIRSCLHYDIDEEVEQVWDHDWDIFLAYYYMMTQENAKIRDEEATTVKSLMPMIGKVLEEMSQYWSQFNLDGVLNIWIVKPSAKCRGRGIILMNDLKKIINFVNPPVVNKGRYVVQKYIERPLIIYNCKFDIRQWFLVTSVQPLIIWMYKESYLRFSSQEFSLANFHESVHLTNHAVQRRYKNGLRDERLPRENMWDCHTFQAYLRQIGKAEMWSERIYPGMQKALIGLLLASQDAMDRRMNTFELFGADFFISEDCQPWLIEINSSPDLGASTSVTARLCPQCLEDVIKVVIDYRNNPKAPTGGFELIYKQIIPPAPAYLGLNLFLKGNQILPKGVAAKKDKSKETSYKTNVNKPNFSVFHERPSSSAPALAQSSPVKQPGNGPQPLPSRPFIIDFMDCMENKNDSKMVRFVRRPNKVKSSFVAQKKPKKIESPPNSTRPKSTCAGLRYLKILNENCDKKMKSNAYARRHASCGSRLASVQPPPPPSQQAMSAGGTDVNHTLVCSAKVINITEIINDEQDIKCVGNRCCVGNLPMIQTSPTATSSGRKHSVDLSMAKGTNSDKLNKAKKPMSGINGRPLRKKQQS